MNMSLHGSVNCAIARGYMLAGAEVTPIRGCMEEYVCMYVAITIPCMYVCMYVPFDERLKEAKQKKEKSISIFLEA